MPEREGSFGARIRLEVRGGSVCRPLRAAEAAALPGVRDMNGIAGIAIGLVNDGF